MHAHADAQLAPASFSKSARSTNAFQREAEAAEHRIAKRLQMLTGWLRMRFGPNPLPSIPEPNPDDMAIMRSLLLPMAAFGMKSFAKCSYDVIFRMCVSAPACWCGVARQLRTLLACARTHTQTHAMHARNELHSRTPFESVRASVCVCVCVCVRAAKKRVPPEAHVRVRG